MTANLITSKQNDSIFKMVLARSELLFWNLAIGLLGKSRLLQTCVRVAYPVPWQRGRGEAHSRVIVWALSGWIGALLLAGLAAGMSLNGQTALFPGSLESAAAHPVVARPENGQQNILVINIDEFDRSPHLKSIWLLMYFPDSPSVTLLPIFPAPVELDPDHGGFVKGHFDLSATGKPTPDFLSALTERNIWWDEYIVLDRVARNELSQALSDGAYQAPSDNPESIFAGFVETLSGRSEALNQQTADLAQFCSQVSRQGTQVNLAHSLGSLRAHYRTDVNLIRLQQDWHSLLNAERSFSCDFPYSNPLNPEVYP